MLSVDWLLLLLRAKAAAASSAALDPLQIQTAMFLLTQEGAIPPRDRYDFRTCEWGPYSPSLRSDLDRLVQEGFVQARNVPGCSSKRYELTATGVEIAHRAHKCITDEAARAIVAGKRRTCLAAFNQLSGDGNLRVPDEPAIPVPRILDEIVLKLPNEEGEPLGMTPV